MNYFQECFLVATTMVGLGCDEAMTNNEFGEFMRRLRESRGLGVNQLAQKASVSGSEVSRIESGTRKRPHPDTLMKLAGALRHPVEDLYKRLGYLTEPEAEESLSPIILRIKELASPLGLDIEQVAKKAGACFDSLVTLNLDDPDPHILWPVAQTLGTSMAYLTGETDDPRPIMQPGQAAHNATDPFGGADLTPEDIRDMERTYIRIEKRREERRRLKGDGGDSSN